MPRFLTALGLGAATLLACGGAFAAEPPYDNPKSDSAAPCVVLNSYEAGPSALTQGSTFGAKANLTNICGRTVEIAFCFLYAEPVEGRDRACYGGFIRPGSGSEVANDLAPVRIVGSDYKWRWRPEAVERR